MADHPLEVITANRQGPRLLLASALLLSAGSVFAFGTGSIVCSVGELPFAPMAGSITQPAPQDWTLTADTRLYAPGQAIALQIRNVDPLKQLRGVLLWAEFTDGSPAGSFLIGPGTPWKYVSLSPTAQCAQGSLTHMNKFAKPQSVLNFSWTAPAGGQVRLRAFLVDNCASNLNVDCRGAQALTNALALSEGIFQAGFE